MCDINLIINELREHIDNPEAGLPEELFLFITEITPMVNVDLLIRNNTGKYLLAWRKEPKPYPDGWHIPGGIVRVKETRNQRIEMTALKEIGCPVSYNPEPLTMIEGIHPEVKIRPHFYSFLYDCRVPDDYVINNKSTLPNETGYLAWHDKFPDNMIKVHYQYKEFFKG
ncbi:hypothetical protein AGMMS50212_14540 [Spirochaetia bacterium]|nr:hypothetical protein AGMMS50212_14540 [Spirochaetia bacterium]